jgi:competence protein ComEA
MNPFLYDTVAQPLPTTQIGAQGLPYSKHQTETEIALKRRHAGIARQPRAGMMALVTVAAGMGSFSACALDVNRASQAELQAIKGVGPRTAQIIVQERQRAGHFESMQDLSDRVRGIGSKKLQTMQQAGLAVGVKSQVPNDVAIGASADGHAAQTRRRSQPAGRISPVVTDVSSTDEPDAR